MCDLGGVLTALAKAVATILPPAPSPPGADSPAAAAPDPVVGIGAARLTGAQARALGAVVSHIVHGAAGVADAEIVADTVIDVALASVPLPFAGLVAPAAEILAASVIEAIASGRARIAPGPAGVNHDPLGRGGRRS